MALAIVLTKFAVRWPGSPHIIWEVHSSPCTGGVRSSLFAVRWRRLAEARPHCDHLGCLPLDFFLGLTDSKSKGFSIFVLDFLRFSDIFSEFRIFSLIFCGFLVCCKVVQDFSSNFKTFL